MKALTFWAILAGIIFGLYKLDVHMQQWNAEYPYYSIRDCKAVWKDGSTSKLIHPPLKGEIENGCLKHGAKLAILFKEGEAPKELAYVEEEVSAGLGIGGAVCQRWAVCDKAPITYQVP